jgi:heptose-I-phosphate ethanolaminephosphotransferase
MKRLSATAPSLLNNPLLWVLALLLYPLIMEVWFSDFVREGEYNSRIGWSLILAFIITWANDRRVTALLLLPFVIGGTLDIGYAYSFGGVFTSATMEAVAYTDRSEILEYLDTYFSWSLFGLLQLFLMIYAGAVYFSRKPDNRKYLQTVSVLGLILIITVIYRTSVMNKFHDTIPGVLGSLPSWYQDAAAVEQAFAERRTLVRENATAATLTAAERPQLHIFIIGESASRHHMSLYGYHRDTSPRLSAMSDQLVTLTNVISSHAQTQASLRVALTAVSAEQEQDFYRSLSVIDIANQAGYKTWWISNQQPARAIIASIAHMADVPHYISNDFHGVEVYRFDEYMLKAIAEAIQDPAPDKAIFIHTMGSHAQYKNRYPDMWASFQGNDIRAYRPDPSAAEVAAINDYDNSVLYTDYFVSEVIRLAAGAIPAAETSVTYFSDHGEEVFQTRNLKGHSPDNLTANMLEIPFVAWFSDLQTRQALALATHTNQPFMLDDFYQYAVDMMNIATAAANPSLSPASPQYQPPRERLVYGRSYETSFRHLSNAEADRASE